jgi:ATP-binding cassette, subfamily C, type I secretion system permease/ATPase
MVAFDGAARTADCNALYVGDSEEGPAVAAQIAKTNLLSDAFRATRSGFLTAVIFSFFINILAFVGPIYMLQIYDRVITSRNMTTLVVITLIAAYLLIVYALLEKIRSAILVRLGILFAAKARAPLFNAVLRGTIIQPGVGHTQALRDLETIREFLTGAGLISFCDTPWVPIFVSGCFILHTWYGYIAAGGAALIFGLAIANELLTRAQLKDASLNSVVASAYASATFRNAEVLHAMGMLRGLRERWLKKQHEGLHLQAVASDRAGNLIAASKFTRAFLQISILGVGAYLSIAQESTPGAMIAASIIMGRALAPVEIAVANWKGFIGARAAYDRIRTLLALIPEETKKMGLPAPSGDISVENVIAGAPGAENAILHGISFALRSSEVLGVVGPSAAGKSSLARVLVGVWPAAVGKVRIDGADLSHWNTEQLGRHIGYLPQDVELFSGSIAENISRFEELDDEKVIAAAKMADVHDMIQMMPAGYNTQIGDGGYTLSGGQRQRIGLARALYGTPAFIVLDEPNANLDAEGEAALLSAVQQLRQEGSTLVLITHKTNILAIVDKILVIVQGQIQGFGMRDEILTKLFGPRVAPVPATIAASRLTGPRG